MLNFNPSTITKPFKLQDYNPKSDYNWSSSNEGSNSGGFISNTFAKVKDTFSGNDWTKFLNNQSSPNAPKNNTPLFILLGFIILIFALKK
jgi:hypothetical protein